MHHDHQFITAALVPSRGWVFSNGSTCKTERQKSKEQHTYVSLHLYALHLLFFILRTIALAWTIGRLLPRRICLQQGMQHASQAISAFVGQQAGHM
jgi:hypothetical protein